MKLLAIVGATMLLLSSVAQAATYHAVDEAFVEQAQSLGVSQSVWDQPEYVAMSFPHAYKFTTYRIKGTGELLLTCCFVYGR